MGKLLPDTLYGLYLAFCRHEKEFDLQEIGQIANVFNEENLAEYVPNEFWQDNLVASLDDALVNYRKYREHIDVKEYLTDLFRALTAFGVGHKAPPQLFLSKIEQICTDNAYEVISLFDAKMTENIIYFLTKAGSKNAKLYD